MCRDCSSSPLQECEVCGDMAVAALLYLDEGKESAGSTVMSDGEEHYSRKKNIR